jgi:hypothetical protein
MKHAEYSSASLHQPGLVSLFSTCVILQAPIKKRAVLFLLASGKQTGKVSLFSYYPNFLI